MIRRVRVAGYKSLRDVRLDLRRLTIVIGPNASGKSNLFDALKLLSRILTSRSLIEAFGDHRGDPLEAFDFGESGISGLLRKPEVQFTIEVDVELEDDAIRRAEQQIQQYRSSEQKNSDKGKPRRIIERLLRYRIAVAMTPETGVLRVIDEYLAALQESSKGGEVDVKVNRLPFLEKTKNRLRLRMEGQARPTEYEVGLNYAIASQPVYPPHYPHLVAFREEVSSWQFYYFEPRLMREENPVKEACSLTPYGGDLAAFYYTLKLKRPEQFYNLQKSLRMIVPTIESIDVELTEEGRLRLLVREHGVNFSAKVISEGTLRLLGLLAILSPTNPAAVVGFEEPENGVHPRRLKLIADLLKNASRKKQIVVNSHSPLLPDYLADDYLVECKKSDGYSVFRPLAAVGLFRRPAVEEALEEVTPVSHRILRGDWE
ncbi:MAG: DNA recombination protein RecF [Candidatus Tectimicrobiota bacterium]|nr:MAG: DNA recombination protein RecF [Candidatus Tectomicrobia bacterium]